MTEFGLSTNPIQNASNTESPRHVSLIQGREHCVRMLKKFRTLGLSLRTG